MKVNITLMKQRMSSKYDFVLTISFDLGLHWAFYYDNGRITTGHISMPSDFPQCLPEMDSLALVSFLFTLSTCEPKISAGFQVRKLMSCIPTSLHHNSQTQRLTLSFFKPCLHFLSGSRDDDDGELCASQWCGHFIRPSTSFPHSINEDQDTGKLNYFLDIKMLMCYDWVNLYLPVHATY